MATSKAAAPTYYDPVMCRSPRSLAHAVARLIDTLLTSEQFAAIWARQELPILCLLPPSPPETATQVLIVRYRSDFATRLRLRGLERLSPTWCTAVGAWQVPIAWLDRLVAQFLEDNGGVYLVHGYQPEQPCTASCRRAKGLVCRCQCLGHHHGSEVDGVELYRIASVFTFTAGAESFSCRELRRG